MPSICCEELDDNTKLFEKLDHLEDNNQSFLADHAMQFWSSNRVGKDQLLSTRIHLAQICTPLEYVIQDLPQCQNQKHLQNLKHLLMAHSCHRQRSCLSSSLLGCLTGPCVVHLGLCLECEC